MRVQKMPASLFLLIRNAAENAQWNSSGIPPNRAGVSAPAFGRKRRSLIIGPGYEEVPNQRNFFTMTDVETWKDCLGYEALPGF